MWSSSLFTVPFLLYEVTIGTIGCWWYPFSNSIFIGLLVLEKTGQVPQIGSGNHCPHCFLGAFHGPSSGISSMSIHPPRWSPQLNDRAVGWCLSSHSSQGSSEWSGQVLVGQIFAWRLAFFWKGCHSPHITGWNCLGWIAGGLRCWNR